MRKDSPEHDIRLRRRGNEWEWALSNHGSLGQLLTGTADSAEEAHTLAFIASVWFSNPEDEDDWI